jgi:hypothetical protein
MCLCALSCASACATHSPADPPKAAAVRDVADVRARLAAAGIGCVHYSTSGQPGRESSPQSDTAQCDLADGESITWTVYPGSVPEGPGSILGTDREPVILTGKNFVMQAPKRLQTKIERATGAH